MAHKGGDMLSSIGTTAVILGVSGVAASAIFGGLPSMVASAFVTGLGGAFTFFASRVDVKWFQEQLKEQGFYNGSIHGSMNEETVDAIRQFQQAHNLPATGAANEETRQALISKGKRAA